MATGSVAPVYCIRYARPHLIHQAPYVIMVAADVLVPNRRQVISNNHGDFIMTSGIYHNAKYSYCHPAIQ